MEVRIARVWLGLAVACLVLPYTVPDPSRAHDRRKRFIWLTTDGRLALPPGTSLTITPSLALPFIRYPPMGFLSNMSISLPFTILFDSLGLTDNQNPYGVLPPIFARSMARKSGVMLADYVAQFLDHRRGKRSPPDKPPFDVFHGGERAILYTVVEEFLENLGMDGHACLLRAICEVHGQPAHKYGMVGEIVKLFFTASKSPYAHLLEEYVEAESAGQQDGECWRFYKDCPKSLFQQTHRNKYTEEEHHEEEEENEVHEFTTNKESAWSLPTKNIKKTPSFSENNQQKTYTKRKEGTKKVYSQPEKTLM